MRILRLIVAVPLIGLLAAGGATIALRRPVAVKVDPPAVPAAVSRPAPATAPVPPAPAAASPELAATTATVLAPAARVDYVKLRHDLDHAASTLERFNRKLLQALTPPEPEPSEDGP